MHHTSLAAIEHVNSHCKPCDFWIGTFIPGSKSKILHLRHRVKNVSKNICAVSSLENWIIMLKNMWSPLEDFEWNKSDSKMLAI